MDYARKIGKRKDSNKFFEKRITMLTTTCYDPLIKDTPQDEYIEDRRLKNWKKWLNERDKIGRRIKSLTGRSRIDQIINSSDKVRSVIEMKNIIEYVSSMGVKPIEEFQKIPINVPDHYDLCLPKIKTILPIKMDLNFQSNLTYVDVPELIEREKGLHELLIRGKTREKFKKFYKIPVITITAPKEDEQYFDSDLTIILKIQDREIIQNKSFDDRCNDKSPIEWNLIFRGMVNERSEKMITFENKGNTVIHYYWRDWSFRSKVQYFVKNDSPFYFNKTDGIILQGNTVRLKIFYLPRNSNVYTESWRLFTNPKLCECPLIFRLWSCAEKMKENIFDNLNISNIDLYLNRRIRDSIIRDILETIITNVDYRKPPEPAYVSLYLENDIFNAKNPYHYYHNNLLLEFREIYCKVVDKPTITWNLSLNDLRGILLLITNPIRRQQMLLRFNNLCKESLKPSLISNHVNDQKYIIVYNLLCSFVNRFEIETEFVTNNCILINEDKSSKQDNLSLSELSVKSFNEKRKKRKSKSNESINEYTPKNTMNLLVKDNIRDQFYMEIFFIRIREFLVETIDQISAAIESYNRLDGIDTSF
ncbi:PREDICTED: uncharacterized protein LOC107070867 [Polistes dominula]|uniref:Uncharacterized protein LOC107070867 n=1 Tax=Polistes dominula TaxID=743375 RepID=A0ABM1IXF8_POLDO|nr:PREDICTED: uncharacterized protein LOC107070867 [Polistes dominula]